MEAKKEAKLNMFNTVLALCEDHLTIVALVVAFNSSYLALKATVAAIATAAAQLEVQSGGLSTSKKTSKKELATLGSGIAGLVYAYAASIHDEDIKEAMNITYTALWRTKDEEVALVCGNIYTMANNHLADLGDFGVTSGMISTFNAAIASYVSKAPKPRLSRSHRKALRVEMNGMFADASWLLKEQMDRVAINFTTNGNSEFYGTYHEARAIIDLYVVSKKATKRVII